MVIMHKYRHSIASLSRFLTLVSRSVSRLVGSVLLVCGGLADGVAGWLALSRGNSWSLLLHVPAVLAWGIGLGMQLRPDTQHEPAVMCTGSSVEEHGRSRRTRQLVAYVSPILRGWTPLIVVLGLVAFPGLAPFAWAVAYTFMRAQDMRLRTSRISRGVQAEELVPSEVSAAQMLSEHIVSSIPCHLADQWLHVSIAPLVDAVREPNIDTRRGAVAVLGNQADRRAARLIRNLLKDPDPDVRSDASVMLSSFEATFGRAISEAAARRAADPSAAKSYAELCYRYATSDILDEASSNFYLVAARGALREYLESQPECADAWVLLAHIHENLSETVEASEAINRALALRQETPEVFRLGAEIAFHQHDWGTLRELASHARRVLADHEDGYEIMRWWAEAQGASAGDALQPIVSPHERAFLVCLPD